MPRLSVKQLTICAICLLIFTTLYSAFINFQNTLNEQNLEFGFDFLFERSGFDIGDTWIAHSANQPYYHAMAIGLLNTVIIAAVGICLSTILGLSIALLAYSPWRIMHIIAQSYIQILRGIPLLVQILFWHTFLILSLPPIRESVTFGSIILNNRGLFFPSSSMLMVVIPLILLEVSAKKRFINHSMIFNVLILFTLSLLLIGDWNYPEMGRFRITNGSSLSLEWLALLISLSTYTASYIAEVIRTGLDAISQHQYEACHALGLSYLQTMRQVILPQAKPIFYPALLNQYLNLTKNASLGIAIGYPDFFAVSAGTILNQSGRTLEIMFLVMIIYSLINQIGMSLISRINQNKWKNHV